MLLRHSGNLAIAWSHKIWQDGITVDIQFTCVVPTPSMSENWNKRQKIQTHLLGCWYIYNILKTQIHK